MIGKDCQRFCCEDISLIENYDKAISDNTQTWHCHHRFETHDEYGNRRVDEDWVIKDLIELGLYYKRPAKELIFLTNSEHSKLHLKTRNERKTEESFRNISLKNKGKIRSEESKRKTSLTLMSHYVSPETRRKIGISHRKENLSEETLRKKSESLLGHYVSPETKNKIGLKHKGRHWYTNGVMNVLEYECPKGFYPGQTR